MKICLVRHGVPEHDPAGNRYIGITDIPLSDAGRSQAVMLGDMLAGSPEAPRLKIFTSPLIRCVETAAIVADRLFISGYAARPVIIDRLHEIDLGEWDGKLISEIRGQETEAYEARGRDLWGYRPPGGENFAEAGKRFCTALDEIASEADAEDFILIVTHAGVIRAGLSIITGETFSDMMKREIPYAEIIEIEVKTE